MLITILIAGFLFAGAIYIDAYHHFRFKDKIVFWFYFGSIVAVFLSIIQFFSFLSTLNDTKQLIENKLIQKNMPLVTNTDNLYNVPAIKRRISLPNGEYYDFYQIHICPTAKKSGVGSNHITSLYQEE
jgi:hypothetical protein